MLMVQNSDNSIYSRELSDLALNAALAIEDVIAGSVGTDLKPVEQFMTRITESIQATNGDKRFADVTLLPFYNRALMTATGESFEDTPTLIATLVSVIDKARLSESDQDFPPEKFRDFCLAMYNSLVSTSMSDRERPSVSGGRQTLE